MTTMTNRELCRVLTASLFLTICPIAAADPSDVPTALLGGVTMDEAAAVANKWSYDLIDPDHLDLWIAVKRATLIDPALHRTFERLAVDGPDIEAFSRRVSRYAWEEVAHLQHSPVFANEPGRMPWGRVRIFRPVYRRLLPSEVFVMERHIGKPAGACESLAFFFAGLFRLYGVGADDIVHLRLADHTVTVISHDGRYFGTNNTAVGPFTPPIRKWHLDQRYRGVLGERFAGLGRFRLEDADLAAGLLDVLAAKLPMSMYPDLVGAVDPHDRAALKARLFGEDGVADERVATLVRYAYQSIHVPSFEPYLVAASRGPLVRALARTLTTEKAIDEWIAASIVDGVILDDERVQMPDQVIVYRGGTDLDRRLLAYTLETLAGISSSWDAGGVTMGRRRSNNGDMET